MDGFLSLHAHGNGRDARRTVRNQRADVFNANYTVTPENMTMEMHMFGMMYAPSDRWTLAAMISQQSMAMDHRIFPMAAPLLALNNGSDTFTTESSGLADLKINALHKFYDREGARAHLGLGLSLPTGSITEEDIVPGPGGRIDRQLPAAMQLGSGTVDFLPSLTAVKQFTRGSIGAQIRGIVRTHDNDQGYRFGHRFEADAWGAINLTKWLGVNAGLGYQWEGELKGVQDDVSQAPPFAPTRLTVPTAFGENYGGRRVDAILGLNLLGPDHSNLSAHRLAIDARFPIDQDVNGVRLETDWTMTIGWQWAF